MSKSELSQITLDTSNSKVMDMLAPYGNVDASAYRFDIHTTRYERGAFIAPRTFSSGSLPVTSTFTPCSSAEVGISGLMNNGYADVILARLVLIQKEFSQVFLAALLEMSSAKMVIFVKMYAH